VSAGAVGAAPARVAPAEAGARAALVRRGLRLNYATIAYNVIEAGVALAAGTTAGSVALVGFGVDSVIEVTASGAAQWRLRADHDAARRARAERVTARVIGASFLALAAWVACESVEALWRREAPARSAVGLALLALSAAVMPVLARAKRRVARAMGSAALDADATQTSLCAYLSLIALAGVALNVTLGWWWADPAAALAMVPIIASEGAAGVRGRAACDGCGCG
jgi:divalent metal cation (Fe/Co/Zn/Cd) transporter